MLQIEHKLCIQRKLEGDNNELLCNYKVRFNTKREYKSNRGDAVCVYVTETKYAPRNPSFFLLALKEKEEAMKNLFPTELTDSPPEKRKKKMVTCKHLEKLYKHICGFSTESLPIWWMPRENVNPLTIPKNRKGLYISPHSMWRQKMAVWTYFRNLSPPICMLGTCCLESLCVMTLMPVF